MKRMVLILAIAGAGAGVLAGPRRAGAPAATHISPQGIAAHVRFLASDALEGRETGTRGFELAANYVAAQFEAIGLQTELQPIAFRSAKLIEEQSSFAIDGQPLTIRKELILRPSFLAQTNEVTAPVVFAGFGIVAPELHHDDYTGLDAHGKIVLLLSGAPTTFPTDQRAFYSGSRLKERTAAAHGAAGILILSTITDEKRHPFEKRAQQSGIAPMLYLDGGRPADAVEGIRASAQINAAAAERLFAGAPMAVDAVLADAEKGIAHTFPLGATVAVRTATQFEEARSENVIGILRGSDPKLGNEFVVVSAHLDHLGTHVGRALSPSEPAESRLRDGIYNGAYDNASGVACLIEIARALQAGPTPRRPVALVAFTGEEQGEQGSEFFVHHSPLPGSIIADVNMDMFLMLYPVADLVALGGEHTTLGAMAARAARDAGFTMSPDPYPEEVRFIRSDQFSFVQQGIPAIHLKPGNASRDPKIDGAAVTRDWLRRVYHSPADDMNQPIDFQSGARYAETNLRLVREIAGAPARPRWNPGDFFAPRSSSHSPAAPRGEGTRARSFSPRAGRRWPKAG